MMINLSRWAVLAAAFAFFTSAHAQAAVISITGSAADAERASDGTIQNSTAASLRAGRFGNSNSERRNAIFVFDLGSVVDVIQSANLGLFLNSITGAPSYNGDLWGVGYSSSSALPASASFLAGSTDAGNTLVADSFVKNSTTTGTVVNTEDAADDVLRDYLTKRTNNFVFFRVNQDSSVSGVAGYNFNSADAATNLPVLTLTTPEPSTWLLSVMGIGWCCVYRKVRVSKGRRSPGGAGARLSDPARRPRP